MDGFSYSNIFETKGIEYLAILAFFAILIPFWIILNKQAKGRKIVQRLIGTITPGNLRIPQGLFFSRNHTWTHLERSGIAKIGLDDLLIHITGEVKVINHAKPGENIKKGDLLAEIEHNGKLLSILSPVSGEIQTTNTMLAGQPQMLHEDPFRKGWIYQIKPSDWKSETKAYYLAGEATHWMSKELVRFKDFVMASAGKNSLTTGIILQDGGELRENTLSELPDELWKEFQKDFLNCTD
ncbi:MAG: glycine cleavage system protein H [Bacteroidales bacterium]|jgi:glycine cleavage system H protein